MTIEELQKKNKQLLELVEKYDKFAEWVKNDYLNEISVEYYLNKNLVTKIVIKTEEVFNALREEFRRVKNEN